MNPTLVQRVALLSSGLLVGSGVTYLCVDRFGKKKATVPSNPKGPPVPHTPYTPRHADILKYGCPSTTQLQLKANYVSQVDHRLNSPVWVMEHLTKENLKGSADRGNVSFKEDQDIPKQFRVSNDDYFKSGYSRGHMSPASNNKNSDTCMRESFLLNSNIVPQDLDNNIYYWNRMEQWVKALATRKGFDSVRVLSGPLMLPSETPPPGTDQNPRIIDPRIIDQPGLIGPQSKNPVLKSAILIPPPSDVYTPPSATDDPPNSMVPGKPFNYVAYKTIGQSQVAVPTHLFKAVLAEKSQGPTKPPALFFASFIVPNTHIPDHVPLNKFQVPKHVLEKYAGIQVWDLAFQSVSVVDLCAVTDPHNKNSCICQLESAVDFKFFTIERELSKAKSRADLDSAFLKAKTAASKFNTDIPNSVMAAYDRRSKSLPSD